MRGKPFSTIVEELNNVLTVVAMCTDEIESLGATSAPMTDLRDAVRRGAELTRALAEMRPPSLPPGGPNERTSDVHPTGATVLVIEDDDVARRSLISDMDGRGWRVLGAASEEEAIQNLESVRGVDVIVTDTKATSRRFASELVARFPSAAVVYLGGYTDDRLLREELPRTEVTLVSRPFERAALVDRVGETLARRR